MAAFPIDLNGAVCADIGASTGGFTDCMLQNGAEKVYAVDVGYGQLAGSSAATPGWCAWSGPTPGISPTSRCRTRWTSLRGRELHLPEADPAAPERPAEGRRPRRLPGEAPVRGRAREGGEEGRGPGPAVHLEVLEHFLDHAGDAGFIVLRLTYSPIRARRGTSSTWDIWKRVPGRSVHLT